MSLTNSSLYLIQIINQLFDLERKLSTIPENKGSLRNIQRIKRNLAEMGYTWHDPEGEVYDETRTDCDASIAGTSFDNLIIKEVIKPIIWLEEYEMRKIIQRAIVVVEGE